MATTATATLYRPTKADTMARKISSAWTWRMPNLGPESIHQVKIIQLEMESDIDGGWLLKRLRLMI